LTLIRHFEKYSFNNLTAALTAVMKDNQKGQLGFQLSNKKAKYLLQVLSISDLQSKAKSGIFNETRGN